MADLGTIGGNGTVGSISPSTVPATGQAFASINDISTIELVDAKNLSAFCVRDDVDGEPTPPCQKQQRVSILKDIYIPVLAGVPITILLSCKFSPLADPRPRIAIAENHDLGIMSPIYGEPALVSGWTLVQVQVTPTADGVLNIWRELRTPGFVSWDNLRVTAP